MQIYASTLPDTKAIKQDSAAADTMAEQYLHLREKQFEYFVSGLEKDWSTIENVRGALTIVQTAAHVKKVASGNVHRWCPLGLWSRETFRDWGGAAGCKRQREENNPKFTNLECLLR